MRKIKEAVDAKEMTNIIYDTLMQNRQYPQFDINKVGEQFTYTNKIDFSYEGKYFNITVTEIK